MWDWEIAEWLGALAVQQLDSQHWHGGSKPPVTQGIWYRLLAPTGFAGSGTQARMQTIAHTYIK